MRRRRYEINRSVLLELKKLQKHISLAIPKLPFQRVVRDICERNNLNFRWARSALGCLHEGAEDFLIEFFQDCYVLTAHAHRSTLMPRDLNSLRLLRFRYDKTLEPVEISDTKMDNILHIPPLGKVKVTDVSSIAHQYSTHLNAAHQNVHNEEREQREEARIELHELQMAEALHEANAKALECLYPYFDVAISLWQRDLYFPLEYHEITILRQPNRELTDIIMNCFLW